MRWLDTLFAWHGIVVGGSPYRDCIAIQLGFKLLVKLAKQYRYIGGNFTDTPVFNFKSSARPVSISRLEKPSGKNIFHKRLDEYFLRVNLADTL